jgi:hypothetical protein
MDIRRIVGVVNPDCTKPGLFLMGAKQDSTGQLNDVLEWSVIPPIKTVTANDNFAFAEDARLAA